MHLNPYLALLTPLTQISLYHQHQQVPLATSSPTSVTHLHWMISSWLSTCVGWSHCAWGYGQGLIVVVTGLSCGHLWVGWSRQLGRHDWRWRMKNEEGRLEKKGERDAFGWFCYVAFSCEGEGTVLSHWMECWCGKMYELDMTSLSYGPYVVMKITKILPLLSFHNSKTPKTYFQFP